MYAEGETESGAALTAGLGTWLLQGTDSKNSRNISLLFGRYLIKYEILFVTLLPHVTLPGKRDARHDG